VFEPGHTSDPNIASFSGAHESDPDLFTSINVEDETLGGSFHTTPPRSTQVPPEGPTSGGAKDLATLTALSYLVSELVQKVSTLESKLQAHKLLFKEVVGTLVKKVKALELKLNTRSRKVVMRESDTEEQDVDPLIKLAKAAAASDAHVDVSPGADVSHSPPPPIGDVPTTEVPTDVHSVGAPIGPSLVSPGSTTVPTSSSVPVADTIPANSGTTPETPSSPLRDVRKGKGVVVKAHSPTHDKTFKQLEEERLGWEAAQRLQAQELADFEKRRAESLMKDAYFARQMSQDFELIEDQRKRQQEVLASAANYSDAAWDIILAPRMVELVNTRRKELAKQRAKVRRERPMTPSQLRQYMLTYVKNQGPAVYFTGWTMAQVRKLSPEQLQDEFDKIQRAVAFTRGLKRDGSPMASDSSKKLKTGDDAVTAEAPSHGGPQEEETAQDKVPSQKATIEDVDAPSNLASTAHHTASSLKKGGTKKKRLGRKGVHTSQSTIPIEEGDPEAEHKVCIKYASDADSASDDDTPVNLYAVVDWELLPTGLGSINAFYRLDNSRKYFTSLREILHLVTRADLMTIYGRVMTFYQDKKAEGVGLVLWGDLKVLMDSPEVNDGSDVWKNQHTWNIQSWKLYSFSGVHVLETVSGLVLHMFVDKKYPLSVNLIERMLDHQLEICHGSVGNELTTAVQLIAFLKKQISDSQRPKVHACSWNFEDSTLLLLVQGFTVSIHWFVFLLLLDVALAAAHSQVSILKLTSEDLSRNLKYVVPTGRVKVPAGRYVVSTGKDNVIVSEGRKKVIPAGRTILVLRVLGKRWLGSHGYLRNPRVWFDKLLPEYIDNYEMLRKAFLGNYSQQNKYIKDPVEIHHIKQREGESTEAFMERFKVESMHVSGAQECMRISGFMHSITNPDLIKNLNDNIPKSVDEMMSVTTTFLRGEVAADNQSKKKAPPAWKHHEIGHRQNFDKRLDFKSQHKSSRRQDRFTPLTKTPKEILAMDTVKFKAPLPMTGPAENQNKKMFYEFHGDKDHSTNECIHLRRQIEEIKQRGK
ncbi:hypothetical protein Tco_0327676, partial [Tanacetum coccineum]